MINKILLVDDEKDIVEFLGYNLKQEGFEIITANDGIEALSKLNENPDLIILDIMMPGMDGYEVCRRIRKTNGYAQTPVILLTAKSGEVNEIKGLETGADDYIQKPISPRKLIARVKANLRGLVKSDRISEIKKIKIGPLNIDKDKYEISINGKVKVFPRKEFELLFYFANNPGKVFNRESLLKEIWGTDVYVVDRTVDVHIRKIREKLGEYMDMIETVKGVGYRFRSVE